MAVRTVFHNHVIPPWAAEGRIPGKTEFVRDQIACLKAVGAPEYEVTARCPCGWQSAPSIRDAAVADLYDHLLSHAEKGR